MRLSVKMILFCLLAGIVPLAGMAGYSLHTASVSLKEQSFSKLVSLQEAKSHELDGLTELWNRDITMYSEAKYVYSALVRLRDIIFYAAQPGQPMDLKNEDYAHALKRVAPDFTPWIKVRGYADALILDDTGRVVFSLAGGRELGEDIAKGPLAKSRLLPAWKQALKGETAFVDFAPYEPLDGQPCAFIAAPIRRYGEGIEGVAVLRIPIEAVNRVMRTRAGLGETGEAYLVGRDGRMRSDLYSDPEGHSVVASFADSRSGGMRSEPARRALAGESGRMDSVDYRGREVLAAYSPVKVGDTDWGLVAKIDASEALAPVRNLKNAALVVSGASVAGIVLITLLFLRVVLLKPLKELRVYAGRVAEGDLAARPRGRFKAELGEVTEAIERMVRNLGEKMGEAEEASRLASSRAAEAEAAAVRAEGERRARTDAARAQREGMLQAAGMLETVVSGMREASATVNQESDRIMEGANSLSARVETTAASMEELAGSIREVADNAETASREAGNARQRAQEGSEVVRRTVDSIGDVHVMTEQLKGQVASLGTKADSIGKVMNVISDIADQTNLLALNAAIEAARAGEAGRGFAVVADEVRKLAEKTMAATREVGGSIAAIQADVRENIKGMDRAATQVDEANRLAGESGQALNEIMAFFETVTGQVAAIAAASTQQSHAGEEINLAVSEVDAVSSQTAEAVAQTGGAIGELTGQIETLSKLYGLFMLLGEGVVQKQVESLAKAPDIITGTPSRQHGLLQRVVRENPSLEMAWVIDPRGVQVTEFAMAHGKADPSKGGPGTRWDDRDWFREPLRTGESFISNIYYSKKIDDYCLTVATPVKDRGGNILSVLAVDVRHAQ
ncbi:methyl-accepting chemotaxis sensory transducer [Pseudodesulfovibrio mercurii]|uniref:Methyl-accepting chemotaxis sensory transducer n=1 Tax=Pseudodesulfovibrio mercurii TaxID=641491 RepID=F0JHT0_9BACT|nr:methyl-accepting chemotaxis protein [Pseudodesulfovibrio mercurii]EGB15316.1 methyl-accepting chemotaxis sensory transducer [Pseudodesulfovibrio mercurii]